MIKTKHIVKRITILLLITILSATTVSALPTTNNSFNLSVTVKPGRHILPHIYAEATFATFEITVMNNGPEESDTYTLDFHIKKILGDNPRIYINQTWHENALNPGWGQGHPITLRVTSQDTFFSIYQVYASITISDTLSKDNQASFYYIVLET